MSFVVLTLGAVSAGTHERHPFLGAHSAFWGGNGDNLGTLPFASVSRKIVDGVSFSASELVDGEPMTVEWQGVPIAKDGARDLIAVTCEHPTWPLTEAFDAMAVPASAMAAGSGKISLPALPDLRCTYLLRYVRDATPVGLILGEHRLSRADIDLPRPRSIHLSYTARRDEMLVIWVAGGGGHLSTPPRVEWGLSSGSYDYTASGTSSTYHASDLCNAPANKSGPINFIDPGAIHRVVLPKLPPSTRIYYRVSTHGSRWSKEHNFLSRRSLTAPASNLKFIMYADQALPVPIFEGAAKMTGQVVKDLEAGYDAFLLHPGDLGYSEGSGYIWDVWGMLIEPISARVPYMVTVGNHEYDHIGRIIESSGAPPGGWHPSWGNLGDDSHGECGVPIAARFNGTGSANTAVSGDNGMFWYSFEEGPVHVTVLSSEHDWTQGSRQYAWLAADLASVDRTVTPWIVLATHRMMYTTQLREEGDYNVSLVFRRQVEPLLAKHKVNLMLVGHQHSYERSCAAYDGKCLPPGTPGTVHMCVGSAGASLERGGFSPALGNFSLAHVNAWGYARLDANASRLRVEFVRTNAHREGEGEGSDGPLEGGLGRRVPAGQVWDQVEILPWV